MAQLVNSGTGDFTTAATWNLVDTTSFLNSEAGTTGSPSTFTSGSPFTPGAITIDGIGLKIFARTVSSASTFSVRLVTGGGASGTTSGTAVAGTTVSLNAADIAVNSAGWYFFKFSSSVTLLAATAYNVQVQSSLVSHVVIYRDATASNWSRLLRTTTTQAPAAADALIVVGDMLSAGSSTVQTVTMDNTAATAFGRLEIGGKGVVSYGSTASTAYQLRLGGNLDIGAGTLELGTAGTPIPSSSSAALEFIVAANVQFGLRLRGDGTLTTYGATKTGRAYLAANAAAAATSLTTDISTGWLNGDQVVLAATTRTATETEVKSLTANASGTTLTIAALTSAHSGTSPTIGELANLTRNVKIFGQSTTLQTYILASATIHNISLNYTEFYFMGSNGANARGIDMNTTSTGILSIVGCAFRNFEVSGSLGINLASVAGANITVSDCVFYRCATNAILTAQSTSSSISISDCWGFSPSTSGSNVFSFNMNSGTISGIVAVGAIGTGSGIIFGGTDIASTMTISNLTAHSNNTSGILFNSNTAVSSTRPTVSSLLVWRNTTRGLSITNSIGFKFDGVTAFGNAVSGVTLVGSTLCADHILKNMVVDAGVTLTQPVGLELNGHTVSTFIEDSTFGATTTHATGDVSVAAARSYYQLYFRNCLFNSATELANRTTNMLPDAFIGSMSHDQVSGASLAWTKSGLITKDTTIYDTSSIGSTSSRLTPNSAALKLRSPAKTVVVPSGRAVTISVKMRWSSTLAGDSANYNGNPTRLWVKKNPSVGINSDTLLATLSVAPDSPFGTFVRVLATTAVATDNGVLSFYVDCDGTTGWVNVDTWTADIT